MVNNRPIANSRDTPEFDVLVRLRPERISHEKPGYPVGESATAFGIHPVAYMYVVEYVCTGTSGTLHVQTQGGIYPCPAPLGSQKAKRLVCM